MCKVLVFGAQQQPEVVVTIVFRRRLRTKGVCGGRGLCFLLNSISLRNKKKNYNPVKLNKYLPNKLKGSLVWNQVPKRHPTRVPGRLQFRTEVLNIRKAGCIA